MKRILSVALLLTFLVGCSSLYTGVVTITSVVDSAMKQWSALSVRGQTSTAIDKAVIAAHDKYREAATVAQTALIAYKAGGNQAEYQNALAAVKAAADGLIQLIVPLVTPTKAQTLTSNLAQAKTL